ncbi:hypothetical protein BP00DRAFT_427275 [Aspergillus indologenus CBS 114.80]|uniref:DUF4396 domain-containing protein n=1 Tax=Aspergillus indologenus CBS 114.80 TaxID=1450541 RepID=A0A2V5J619_9EURO|nr:hypothetical protein BP00DRAFT_427275 [Aspergillus indologenus CBS 114.80]
MYLHCRSVISRRTRPPPSLSSLLGSRVYHQQCSPPKEGSKPCHNSTEHSPQTTSASSAPQPSPYSILNRSFWTCRSTWKRARINTLRCLIGCTIGDFSALWMLQSFAPGLGMGTIMGLSMASGITTSIILETYLLWRGADQLSLAMACRTAMGMSMVSMLAMEIAENAVDYHLTGGVVAVGDPQFWLAAGVSVGAGYLAPLPYNYWRLRKYGKACH